ncbi:hypothetical protein, partial [Caballeronia terrestris]|uniref:hypothetical protein n=1 Tax=Caballeronia terrestris TaxID=1226301 RepID=UPI001F37B627
RLAGLVASFCRNQPCLSLSTRRASSVRFAGLAPALDPALHPLEIRKRLFNVMVVAKAFDMPKKSQIVGSRLVHRQRFKVRS